MLYYTPYDTVITRKKRSVIPMNEQTNRIYPVKNDETEIDLIDLTHAIFRRWRVVLATGVVLGAVIGGYKGATGFMKLQNKEYLAENNATYESEMLQYTSSKQSLEQQIQKYTDEINKNQEYQDTSILMSIDPYDAYRETATFYVSTNYQIMPEMNYQNPDKTKNVIGAYLAIANNGQLYKNVLTELGDDMTIRNLKELVNVNADYDNNLLSITVYGKDKEMASNLMKLLREELLKEKDTISSGVGEHTIALVEQSSINSVDEDLKQKHDDFNKNMTTLQSGLSDRQTKLAALKKPTSTLISKGSVVKNIVRFGIVGVFLGFILSAGFIFMSYVFGGKIHTAYDPERLGLRVLGDCHEVVRKRPFAFLDSFVGRIFGVRSEDCDLNRVCGVAMARLQGMIKAEGYERTKISIVSSLEYAELEWVADALKTASKEIEIEEIGNIITDAAATADLEKVESVILVEKKEMTKKKDLMKEIEILRDVHKEIAGIILL